ncbi:MAG TPA: hypothetical protein VGL83_16865 [Stellaceae bacterium]|jgi:hypothetical protein
MSDYAYNQLGGVIRKIDGAIIPADPRNADYQTFIASGETPNAYIAPAPTVAQSYIAAIVAGCTIASAGTPALNGTYAICGPTWADMKDEAQYIQTFGVFSGNQTSIGWELLGSGAIAFTAPAQLLAVVRSLGDYLTALKIAAKQLTWTAPAQPKAIS